MNKNIVNDKNISNFADKLSDLMTNSHEKWAIYGTGEGAELIYSAACKAELVLLIKYVVEKDDRVQAGSAFHGIPIVKFSEKHDELDGVIIAAFASHEIIKKRLDEEIIELKRTGIKVIDIFTYNTEKEKNEYTEYVEKSILKESTDFVEFSADGYCPLEGDPKVLTWYLPQFHQMEINNKFHGQGFTEWTNTSRAVPLYTGHYQPHIPYDVGYYDLLNIDTFKRQIFLAKHYGIYGFCFHYYWFSGRKIMEKPIEMLLKHKELDVPFCIDWATENWTTLWDGGNREIMLEQKLEDGDDEKFMDDIMPYMKDGRYIKIDGRPVLVIYRINIFEKHRAKQLLDNFRRRAREEGFSDLYIALTNALGFNDDVNEWGADAIVEYPPHGIGHLVDIERPRGYLNPYFKGTIADATSFVDNKKYMLQHPSQKYFRSALTSWDNTARKATSNCWVFQGLTPITFKRWLIDIIMESKKMHAESENIVFVNSWNEWAEGSHLEPDMKYGYAYLQALKEALEETR